MVASRSSMIAGPCMRRARTQRIAVIHRRLPKAVAKECGTYAFLLRAGSAGIHLRNGQVRQPAAAAHPQRHQLHGDTVVNRGVAGGVSGSESGTNAWHRRLVDAAGRKLEVDFVQLAEQPHVGRAFDNHVARHDAGRFRRACVSAASSFSTASMRAATPGSSSRIGWLRTCSKLSGAARKPNAEAAPEAGGISTSRTPRMRATPAAWAGPAPPKPTMA